MTRAARIALYRYHRWRFPIIRVRVHGCETPLENMLRESFNQIVPAYFIGKPIPLAERFRGTTMSAGPVRYFGVME
jgi:hypothetical protein